MGKIVLTSCGIINEEIRQQFYDLIPKEELKDKKVLYITTAVDGESDGDRTWMNEEFSSILDLGINENNVVEYKIGLSSDNVEDFDLIYMMGGNTFYLLDVIRKTGFDVTIRNFLEKGKVYIGSSAGSIIMGSTIKSALLLDENNIGMVDFTGLGFVNGVIIPHANKIEEEIKQFKKETRERITLLCDGEGIII